GRLTLHFFGAGEQNLASLSTFHRVTDHGQCFHCGVEGSPGEILPSSVDKVLEADCIRCVCETVLKLPTTACAKRVAAAVGWAARGQPPPPVQPKRAVVAKSSVYRAVPESRAQLLGGQSAAIPYGWIREQWAEQEELGAADEASQQHAAESPAKLLQPRPKQRAGVTFHSGSPSGMAPTKALVLRPLVAGPVARAKSTSWGGPQLPKAPPPAMMAAMPKCAAGRAPIRRQGVQNGAWKSQNGDLLDCRPAGGDDVEESQDVDENGISWEGRVVKDEAFGDMDLLDQDHEAECDPFAEEFVEELAEEAEFTEGAAEDDILVVDDADEETSFCVEAEDQDDVFQDGQEAGEEWGEGRVENEINNNNNNTNDDVGEAEAERETFEDPGAAWQLMGNSVPQDLHYPTTWQPRKRRRR
ncbi:unnamed protein product, partial [Polarella glacialis]